MELKRKKGFSVLTTLARPTVVIDGRLECFLRQSFLFYAYNRCIETLVKGLRGSQLPDTIQPPCACVPCGIPPSPSLCHDALFYRYALALPTLDVPMALTTTVGRPWMVPFMTLPVWARWAAFFPALMSTVLLFMDQNITVRLVNSKQNKLKKG